jgi:hypothetical protein
LGWFIDMAHEPACSKPPSMLIESLHFELTNVVP